MEYRALGPLEVLDGSGHKLPLGGARQQTVLASLLLRAGKTVGLERLVDELWEEPPATAARTIQTYISRLRHLLPAGAIESRPGGYALLLNGARLDLHTFEQTAEEGRAALASGEQERAAQLLREALALWRGPALAGLTSDALRREASRLEELRFGVLEDRLEADLACGRQRKIVPELQALVAEHPFRERPRAQLMLALYRVGRSSDALEVYRETRRLLVEELGMEPGQELRSLEQAILQADTGLDLPQAKAQTTFVPERRAGTVTFLFTDVEGSTRLVRQLRDRYPEVLADHQRLVRDAFARHDGEEVDTQGDAFFYVFSRARDAAAGAAEAQRRLQAHAWPEDAELRVRMGLHTGEPVVSEERYHGLGVHRAARIMAAGHGGQILASQATAAMLADDELPGVEQRDLGEFRLKDLDHPEHVYQLDVEGLPATFPPLRTGEAPTAYAGKEEELVEAVAGASRPLYRRPLVIGALAGVLAAAVAIPVFALGMGSGGQAELERVQDNAVAVVDAQSRAIVDEAAEIASPQRVAAGEGSIWVTSSSGRRQRHAPRSREPRRHRHDRGRQRSGRYRRRRGSRLGGQLARRNRLAHRPGHRRCCRRRSPSGTRRPAVAFGAGAVWVTNTVDRSVSKIDPANRQGRAADRRRRGRARDRGRRRRRLGNRSGRQRARALRPALGHARKGSPSGAVPTAVAYGNGALWVTNSLDGTVSRVDARRAIVADTIPVGAAPNGVAVAPDGVVGDQRGRRHARPPRSGRWQNRRDDSRRAAAGRDPRGRLALGRRAGRRRRPPRRHPQAGWRFDASDSIDPARGWPLAALLGGVRRARRLQARRRQRREHPRTRPRERASHTHRRRQDVHVPAARGHQVRRRPRAQGICRPLLARAAVQSEDAAAGLLRRHRRRSRLPEATEAVQPVEGRPDRQRGGDRHDQTTRAGSRFSLQAGAAVCVRRPDRHTRDGQQARARYGPVPDRGVHAGATASGSSATATSGCGRRRLSRKASRTRSCSSSGAPPTRG